MPKKVATLKYRVDTKAGRRPFPMDMLRYDGAYPADELQSNRISDTFWTHSATAESEEPESQKAGSDHSIVLVATANGCPCNPRWESFGWRVTHVWSGYSWEPYNGQRVLK